MKKYLALILAGVMILSVFSGCGGATAASSEPASAEAEPASVEAGPASAEDDSGAAPMVGGWSRNQGGLALEENPNAEAAFEKAVGNLLGGNYEPIAVLATQLVSGTNYCILCRYTVAAPDAAPNFQLLYIYEDLAGNASLTDTRDLVGEPLLGGFTANDGEIEPSGEVKAAYEKVMEDRKDVESEPVAYIASQVVAGTNYLVLCRETAAKESSEKDFFLLTIYQALDGNVELNNVEKLEIGG